MQAAIVKGEDVDLEGLTRLSNCVSRVLSQLGVKRERRDTTPSLAEYLPRTTVSVSREETAFSFPVAVGALRQPTRRPAASVRARRSALRLET